MTESCVSEAISIQPAIDPAPPASKSLTEIERTYDGSEIVFRLMRMETTGSTLMNLGYFRIAGRLGFLFDRLAGAQMRLVHQSVGLLNAASGHTVLDIACGRGQSSYVLQCLHPASEVVGIDLSERNIEVANTLYGRHHGLRYRSGNAMDLDFPDHSFDRLICLEAAFHFSDRSQFLSEAFRVLRPGGRLVVVDFAWTTEHDRASCKTWAVQLVRRAWSWADFSSVAEYQTIAQVVGFENGRHCDWTSRVTAPISAQLNCVSKLGGSDWGRRFLRWRNPLYRSLSRRDFESFRQIAEAHEEVQRCSRYMAFVFDKPDASKPTLGAA